MRRTVATVGALAVLNGLAAVRTVVVSPDRRFGAALSELDRIRAEHPADPVEIVVADGTYFFSKPLEIDGVRAGEGMGEVRFEVRRHDGKTK